MNSPTPDLTEAQRLLDAGFHLVPLHHNEKRPVGNNWNTNPPLKVINPEATGVGLPLVLNGLCSVDPDHYEMSKVGVAAWGFDLDVLLAAGVQTESTRPNSGGRSAFSADPDNMLSWLKFVAFPEGSNNGLIVLELRAKSDNLQDVCPGLVYADKVTGELFSQRYANGKTFDDKPSLPADFLKFWRMMSMDDDYKKEQSKKFIDAVAAAGFTVSEQRIRHIPPLSSGGKLDYPAKGIRGPFNRKHEVESLLELHGYQYHSKDGRWSHPGATGAPGIRAIKDKDGLWQSDHGGDPLSGTFDAWVAHVQLEHGGNLAAAIAASPNDLIVEADVVEPVELTADILASMSCGAIIDMAIAPEDYCFQDSDESGLFSTKDFIQLYGSTGSSKTLIAVSMASAIASGTPWLDWPAKKPRRVLFLDGELADITIQKRLLLATSQMLPEEVALVRQNLLVFNRDIMFSKHGINLPPLDSPEGHAQMMDIIEALEVDAVFFDSRFCLLKADMRDSESMPKKLNLELRNKSILQVWIHHAGKMVENGGYGDKTAEFLMDTNIALSPYLDENSGQVGVEVVFQKKRKEEPLNEHFYATKVIQLVGGTWQYVVGAEPKSDRRRGRPKKSTSKATRVQDYIRPHLKSMDRDNTGMGVGVVSRKEFMKHMVEKSGLFADGDSENSFRSTVNRELEGLTTRGGITLTKSRITIIKTSVFDAL